jgi:hypothetical protein
VLDVNRHELGLQLTEDAKFKASLHTDGDVAHADDWVDPRKGDLFALVDLLVKIKKRQEERKSVQTPARLTLNERLG